MTADQRKIQHLLEVIESNRKRIDQIFNKVDFGKTALDASDITAMNDFYLESNHPYRSYDESVQEEDFIITTVCRDDLIASFPEHKDKIEQFDDTVMMTLANKMGDDYCEQLFHDSLKIIADDCMELFKQEEV